MAEPKDKDYVLAFDTLYTTNHIQMLKVILPHLEAEQQYQLAIFIKYLEFQYALSYTRTSRQQINICTNQKEATDIRQLLSDLQAYCTEDEKRKMKQLSDFMQSFEMLKEMQKYKDLFTTSAFPDTEREGSTASSTDFSGLLKSLLSPEQQAMFEMFQTNEF